MATVKQIARFVGSLRTTDTDIHTVVTVPGITGLTNNYAIGIEAKLVGVRVNGIYAAKTLIHASGVAACDTFAGLAVHPTIPSEMVGTTLTGVGDVLGTAILSVIDGELCLRITPNAADATDWFGVLELVVFQPA